MKDKKFNEYMYYSTFAHEFCYILGFRGSLYGMFVDANRKTIRESNLLKVGEFGDQKFFMYTHPKVVKVAREFL